MAIAETAKLLASLELKDNFTKGAKAAEASLGRLEKRVGGIGGKFTKGLKNVGSSIKGALSGPLGALGLGAGLLGLQQFLSGSIDKAQEFADAVMRVQAITGMSAQQTSQLVDVLGDYGLAIDKVKNVAGIYGKSTGLLTKGNANYSKELHKAEKELGRHLTATEKLRLSQKNAIKFQKEFGFNILDGQGKVKDFRTALLDAADVFTNKSIPASRKAALMMKLFGRNWQELIPLLKKGKAGLEETLGKGLVLTDKQSKSLEKSRVATRNWQDALDELQIAIGVELLPAITRFQRRATTFIQEHGDEIVAFFRKAAHFAVEMGSAIKNDVLPWIQRIGDFWAGIPDDLKKVLIGGFVLNKVSGGAITGIFSELAKGLVKGVLGITAGVVNIKAATVAGGGGGGTAGAAGKGAGLLGKVGTAIAVVGSVALVGEALNLAYQTGQDIKEQTAAVKSKFDDFLSSNPTQDQINRVIDAQLKVPDALDPIKRALFEMNIGGVKTTWEEGLAALRAQPGAIAKQLAGEQAKAFGDVFKPAQGPVPVDPAILGAIRALKNPKVSDSKLTARIGAAITAIKHGATISEKGLKQLEGSVRGRLRDAIRNGDVTLARKLENQLGVLHQIRNKKMSVKVNQNQRQASTIVASTASGGKRAPVVKHYSDSQKQDYSRFLATGAVGVASKATPVIFGEAGREAYAILKNPRKGTLGGTQAPPIVHVHVNIDPRRITRKQNASGVYKTYVAT